MQMARVFRSRSHVSIGVRFPASACVGPAYQSVDLGFCVRAFQLVSSCGQSLLRTASNPSTGSMMSPARIARLYFSRVIPVVL